MKETVREIGSTVARSGGFNAFLGLLAAITAYVDGSAIALFLALVMMWVSGVLYADYTGGSIV